jgi:periplasmic nitrate reductase NapE
MANDLLGGDGDSSLEKTRERRTFLFLTVLLAPTLAIAVVGAYGFVIWVYQMFVGPPTS